MWTLARCARSCKARLGAAASTDGPERAGRMQVRRLRAAELWR